VSAFAGNIVAVKTAVRFSVSPRLKAKAFVLRVIEVAEIGAVTVKLTSKLALVMLAPLTVTVAVWVPAGRLSLGTTVNVLVPLAAMLVTLVFESVNFAESVPDRAMLQLYRA
jgi:hypothetical protein